MKIGGRDIRIREHNVELSKFTRDRFVRMLERIEVKKNEYLIHEGDVEQYLYFIEKGMLNLVTRDQNGENVSIWFFFEGEFCNAYKSFLMKTPSRAGVQAMTQCALWRISRENFFEYLKSSHEAKNTAWNIMEMMFIIKLDHRILLLKYKPEERYKHFLVEEPEIAERVPLKYVASYLGMTAPTLSRIRRRIMKD